MPSYLRLLTEQPAHIGIPPTGHTALYASSGTGGENKYELYIKNPEGFSHPVGLFASGGTVSGHAVFNSGVTVYSGGYTSSGSPFVAMAINGTISGVTGEGDNAAGGGVIIQPNLTVSGTMSGTTQILVGSGHTNTAGAFSTAIGKAHATSGILSVAFGSGNTASGLGSFAAGKHHTASGSYSFAANSGNTSYGVNSYSFGQLNYASGFTSGALGFGNTSKGAANLAIGSGTTAGAMQSGGAVDGFACFAAGSATTSSGKTHFVVGRGNISSDLFVVGNGTNTFYNNAFTVGHSGVTVLSSGSTFQSAKGNRFAALTIHSGSGQNALGFMLPRVDSTDWSTYGGFDPAMSAITQYNLDNRGLMFWDGRNIRVWTGGTMWATVALSGSCVYY